MVLIFFKAITGLRVNGSKSEIVPVGDVENLNVLARVLCYKVGSLPMTYLGMPLRAHYKDSSIWNPYRKDGEAALWLETSISVKRQQAYFIKEYLL